MGIKKIALIGGTLVLAVAANSKGSESGVQKTNVEIKNTNLLNTLKLNSNIVIFSTRCD